MRDLREAYYFWADNELVDAYLPDLGVHAFAVYMVLARYANKNSHQCFPSIGSLAKTLGITKPTVRKALDTLVEYGLITVEQRRKANKQSNDSHLYTLLSVRAKPPTLDEDF